MRTYIAAIAAGLLLLPEVAAAQGGCNFPIPVNLNLAGTIVYSRMDSPTGWVWWNDGNGYEQPFLEGQLPKISSDGWTMLYMNHVAPANPCVGGEWVRFDMLTWETTDSAGGANPGTLVGYDFRDADSTMVVAGPTGLRRVTFYNAPLALVSNQPQDGGPDIRQQDGVVVCHNPTEGLQVIAGASRTIIPNTTGFDVWPAWSPDGQWILFGRSSALYPQTGDQLFHVHNYYKVRPDGTDLTPLTNFPATDSARFVGGGGWSPDGQAVIVGGTINGRHGLWALKADGSWLLDSVQTTPGARINFVGSGANHAFTVPATITGLTASAAAAPATLYPNPATETAYLTFAQPAWAGQVEVLDAMGRTVRQETLPAGTTQFKLDLYPLTPGIYACRWRTAAGSGAHQLVVR